MKQIKCKECGNVFDVNMSNCPNCGCPASESEQITTKMPEKLKKTLATSNLMTTDVGYDYEDEKKIREYAKYVFLCLIIVGALTYFSVLISVTQLYGLMSATICALIFAAPTILFAFVGKVVLLVYANISINLREINMKIKQANEMSK